MILQVNVLRVSLLDLHIFPVLVAPTYESAMLLGISLSSPTHYYVRHLFHQFKCWSFWVVTNWGISSKQKSAPFQSVNIQKSKKSNFIWEKNCFDRWRHSWTWTSSMERSAKCRERERVEREHRQTEKTVGVNFWWYCTITISINSTDAMTSMSRTLFKQLEFMIVSDLFVCLDFYVLSKPCSHLSVLHCKLLRFREATIF